MKSLRYASQKVNPLNSLFSSYTLSMEFTCYCQKKKPIFVYCHAELLTPASFKQQIKELKKNFNLVLPHLTPIESTQKAAKQIIQYIKETFDQPVQVLAGFSLGANVALDILGLDPHFCEVALIESPLLVRPKWPFPTDLFIRHTRHLARGKTINSILYFARFSDEADKEGFLTSFQQLDHDSLCTQLDLLYQSTLPDLSQYKGKMAILVGQRERKIYKQSANLLKEKVSQADLYMLMNYTHGSLSLGHPEEYIRFVKSYVQQKDRVIRRQQSKKQEGPYQANWKHLRDKWKAKKAPAR